MTSVRLAALLTLLTTCACVPAETESPSALWTTASLRDAARAHAVLAGRLRAEDVFSLRGQPVPFQSPPFGPSELRQSASFDGLTVSPSFTEGEPTAYVTTEFWYDLAPVWAQPEYRLVTEWDPLEPGRHLLAGARPIFSVGPGSPFYSPYWRVLYVVVPADTDPSALRSVKQVLDPGYPIHPGKLRVCSLVPEDVGLASSPTERPVRPLTGEPIGQPLRVKGWVEGASVDVLDFGADRVPVNDREVVREDALFHFQGRNGTGDLVDLDLPSVAGVGPYRSHARADAPDGVPHFGALWRLYAVTLPATAAVFIPDDHGALRERVLQTGGINVPEVAASASADPRAPAYLLRVAIDGRCFGPDGGFPDGCTWLDSQARIEALSEDHFEETDFTASCSLLEFHGLPVGGP